MEQKDCPNGLLMALAGDPAAYAVFKRLSEEKQAALVARAKAASSRREMREMVHRLGQGRDGQSIG